MAEYDARYRAGTCIPVDYTIGPPTSGEAPRSPSSRAASPGSAGREDGVRHPALGVGPPTSGEVPTSRMGHNVTKGG